MSAPSSNKRKNKSKYFSKSKNKDKRGIPYLGPGMKGFLLTCNNREREATSEAYRLLNDYADEMYGPEITQNTDENGSSEDDIEKAIGKEVNDIKDLKKAKRRFQKVDTRTRNTVFIKTTLENPHQLLHHIISDINDKQICKTQHILRIYPVLGTFKISETDKFADEASVFLTPFLGDGDGWKYTINFKKRNNEFTKRDDILQALSNAIREMNPKNTVDNDSPFYVINVDIFISMCCISIATDFFKFKKYNLQELIKVKDSILEENDEPLDSILEENDELPDSILEENDEPPSKKNKDDAHSTSVALTNDPIEGDGPKLEICL